MRTSQSRRTPWMIRVMVAVAALLIAVTSVSAQITPAQRKEVKAIAAMLGQVKGALRKDDRETASEKLSEAEAAFEALKQDTGLDDTAPVFSSLTKLFASRKADLGEGESIPTGPASVNSGAVDPAAANGVSFVRDVVPIMTGKCLRCHTGARARGGLDLSTFAGMKAGGDGGPLLVRGQPAQSQLIERVVTDDFDLRMPKGGQLFDDEIAVLTKWITDGAAFDGVGETTPLRQLARAKASPKELVIPKPKGTETVSFSNDIGPMFNRICLQCHQGNNPSGGLSLVTFNDLMIGGDSGAVIIPGDAENSRLFRLVGGLELPRMPGDNQLRIRRSEYDALKTWFAEGNVFDGPDPAAPLLSYIDTPEKMAARERASRSQADWLAAREEDTKALWKRGMPLISPKYATSGSVFAAGNADNLESLASVASEYWTELASKFGALDGVEKGVSLLIVDSSYGHREMARTLAQMEVDEPFHAFTTADEETRYAAFDVSSASAEKLMEEERAKVATASAYFLSKGPGVPKWLAEGAGRALVVRTDSSDVAKLWRRKGAAAVARVSPTDLFNDSSYDTEDLGAVGFNIVDALIDAAGAERFGRFATALGKGMPIEQAVRQAYGRTVGDLGRALKSGG